MKHHFKWTALLLVVLSAGLVACEEPYHQKDEQYYFISANINIPYWQEAQAGLADAAKTMGVKAEMDGPTTLSPKDELDSFQKAVALHPCGILVSVSNADLFKDPINAAVAAGIPVIAIDADSPDPSASCLSAPTISRPARKAASAWPTFSRATAKSSSSRFPVNPTSTNASAASTKPSKNLPGIKIVQTIDDKGDPRQAYDGISAMIQKKQKVDGVICLEASGGAGVADALHRVDMTGKVAIVSFDKDPETFSWIDRGGINATVTQKPYVMAFYGVRFLDDLHHNVVHEFKDWRTAPAPSMPSWVDTGTAIVDKSNLSAFKDALAAHPKPL